MPEKSPKFQTLPVDPNVLFKKVIVLDAHLGVSLLKVASGLKNVSTGIKTESLQPLLLVATSVQVNVWFDELLGFM